MAQKNFGPIDQNIPVNSDTVKNMEMESFFGKIKVLIMVSGQTVKWADKVVKLSQMVKSTLVYIKKASLMAKVDSFSTMAKNKKVFSKKESS